MQEWFSLSDIGGLPGLPSSRWGLKKKAIREAWQSRQRKAIGGGLEYHISSLPRETQQALNKRNNEARLNSSQAHKIGKAEGAKLELKENFAKSINKNRGLESALKAECLEGAAKDRMNAKLEIIKLWEDFEKESSESKTATQHLFCSAYNREELGAPAWVKEIIQTVSQSSLVSWIKQLRKEGISSLAGKYGNRKHSGIFYTNLHLQDYVIAMIGQFPHCNAKQVWQGIRANLQRLELEKLPSLKTTARFMNDWKRDNQAEYELMKNPDKHRAKYTPAFGNASEGITRYLQLWETDSTPTDIMLKDGRHTIIGVIDVASRRPKVLISKTSNSTAIGLLIRKSILDWGVPECVRTDNGSDYVSRRIIELFRSLDIRHDLCPPFTPQRKPHIERFFRTLSEHLELLPGFIGHSVAERKDIEQRKSFAERFSKASQEKACDELTNLTAAELQEECDNWIENVYLKSPHSGLIGITPLDFINSLLSSGQVIRRITDPVNIRALDYLLAEVPDNNGKRKVTKKGIRVDKLNFIADELFAHVGQQVRVKYDPLDAGYINVYSPDGEWICEAQCPEITGASRAEVAKLAAEKSKQLKNEQRKKHRSLLRKIKPENVAKEILQNYKEMPGKEIGPENVVEHSSNALQDAANQILVTDAMREPQTFEEINAAAGKLTKDQEESFAKVIDLDARRKSAEEREEEEEKARKARYEALEAVGFQGISPEDDNWRKSWEQTSECFAYKMRKKLLEENQQIIASSRNTGVC